MNGEKVLDVKDSTQNLIKAFDLRGLYEMECYTDMVAGQIQKFTPVNEHGVRDTTRFVRFFSSVTVNQGGRPFTLQFEIAAKSLSEAFSLFQKEATKAAMEFLDRMESERMRRNLVGGKLAADVKPLVLPH